MNKVQAGYYLRATVYASRELGTLTPPPEAPQG